MDNSQTTVSLLDTTSNAHDHKLLQSRLESLSLHKSDILAKSLLPSCTSIPFPLSESNTHTFTNDELAKNAPIMLDDDFHILIQTAPDTPPETSELNDDDESVSPTSSHHRANRVRFRSRVRIASGIHRHRPKPLPISNNQYTLSHEDSSMSSSPSSSISAPLRVHSGEGPDGTGWGSLGSRVGKLANAQRKYPRGRSERKQKRYGLDQRCRTRRSSTEDVDERTPLTDSRCHPRAYTESRPMRVESEVYDFENEEDVQYAQEVDFVFGKWPSRLLNRHWWWWQLEPIVCCHCIDDSDSEF